MEKLSLQVPTHVTRKTHSSQCPYDPNKAEPEVCVSFLLCQLPPEYAVQDALAVQEEASLLPQVLLTMTQNNRACWAALLFKVIFDRSYRSNSVPLALIVGKGVSHPGFCFPSSSCIW